MPDKRSDCRNIFFWRNILAKIESSKSQRIKLPFTPNITLFQNSEKPHFFHPAAHPAKSIVGVASPHAQLTATTHFSLRPDTLRPPHRYLYYIIPARSREKRRYIFLKILCKFVGVCPKVAIFAIRKQANQ